MAVKVPVLVLKLRNRKNDQDGLGNNLLFPPLHHGDNASQAMTNKTSAKILDVTILQMINIQCLNLLEETKKDVDTRF